MRRFTALATLACALLAPGAAQAAAGEEVTRLLAGPAPPPGVVFEVVSANEAELERVLPLVREHARRLRERFPQLPVAVLTHGSEQFSLLTRNEERYAPLHALVGAFTEQERIPVQVCGNHASFRGNSAADFPGYVEVVPSAPSKLSEYRDAGFVVIGM